MNFSKFDQSENLELLQTQFFFNLPFWIAAAITGLIAVTFAQLFSFSEEWALAQSSHNYFYVLVPASIIGSFLIGHFFSKEAIGSGIPQIIASIDMQPSEKTESTIDRLFSVRMLLVKIVGSCVCSLGGGSIGREGPTLQISAAIFHQLGKYWPKSLSKPPQHLMILAGGAGGLAAAFNTPLGGIVFAIEELSKTHISHIRTSVFQAVIIAGIISQMFLGNYLYLGHPQLDILASGVFVHTLLIAAIVGFTGAFFAEGLYLAGKWRARQRFSRKLLMTLACAAIFTFLLWLCGPSVLGGGKRFMLEALQKPEGAADIYLPLGRVFGNFFTYISGVVGGVFAPALASGAAMAQFITSALGFEAPRVMMLVGMVAFLTGLTRTPFTSFVLVLEMTNSHEVILYLMLSSFVASLVSYLVNSKSFYEQAAHDIQENAATKELNANPAI